MEITSHRKCARCGQKTVPRGVDWLWWENGQPVGVECWKSQPADSGETSVKECPNGHLLVHPTADPSQCAVGDCPYSLFAPSHPTPDSYDAEKRRQLRPAAEQLVESIRPILDAQVAAKPADSGNTTIQTLMTIPKIKGLAFSDSKVVIDLTRLVDSMIAAAVQAERQAVLEKVITLVNSRPDSSNYIDLDEQRELEAALLEGGKPLPITKQQYVKLAGEVREIVDKEESA